MNSVELCAAYGKYLNRVTQKTKQNKKKQKKKTKKKNKMNSPRRTHFLIKGYTYLDGVISKVGFRY